MTDDRLLLGDMLEAISHVLEFASEGRAAFMKDKRSQHAVLRNLQVMGEAAKRVSSDMRARHPEIPWSLMARTRDKLIHDYAGVDLHIVWTIIESQLPVLRAQLTSILKGP